ncbi:MAG: ABC transporter ATP-binding protein [Thermodesulfobacteria bacterium]|nr:ABC transporter ATP-binding protein [Thermodesulfobacteriota bacterium]
MARPILELKNLCAGYRGKSVVSQVDFNIHAGQFISLLGPNGAGKTTLLRTLSGHIPPISGDVLIEGISIGKYATGELAKKMAVVLTEQVAPPLFSVRQFVALGRYPHTNFLGTLKKKDKRAVKFALDTVEAGRLGERNFLDLSDGERQKVLLARALCQEPKILILDEPTAHLDLKHRVEVMTILRRLCMEQGLTVICSLHDVDLAARVADMAVLIRDGTVLGFGPPEDVLTPEAVSGLYDFELATFSKELVSIELRSNPTLGKVFVTGGAGSCSPVLRALSKMGFRLATGVLFENDIDFFVAKALGAKIISHTPESPISSEKLAMAIKEAGRCVALVDAIQGNAAYLRANCKIIEETKKMGIKVFERDELKLLFSYLARPMEKGSDPP